MQLVGKCGNHNTFFSVIYIPPDEESIRGQIEYKKEEAKKMPRRRPGDRYPVTGAIIGVIVGGILGTKTNSPILIVICALGGGIIGVMVGSLIGYLVMKIQKYIRDRRQED